MARKYVRRPPCPACGGPRYNPATNKCVTCNQEDFPNPYVLIEGEWMMFNQW